MVAHIGTKFGGFGEPFDAASTSCTVSSDGCMLNYKTISFLRHVQSSKTNALEDPLRRNVRSKVNDDSKLKAPRKALMTPSGRSSRVCSGP